MIDWIFIESCRVNAESVINDIIDEDDDYNLDVNTKLSPQTRTDASPAVTMTSLTPTRHQPPHHRLQPQHQQLETSSVHPGDWAVTMSTTPGRVLQTRPLRKSAVLGSSRILECDVRYPGGVYVQHIVTWRKDGVEAPIFILFDGYPPRLDSTYYGRIRAVGQASIEISNITKDDQGLYVCSVLFLDRSDDMSVNGTWIYLSVNGGWSCSCMRVRVWSRRLVVVYHVLQRLAEAYLLESHAD
jgi:hypothetical protein